KLIIRLEARAASAGAAGGAAGAAGADAGDVASFALARNSGGTDSVVPATAALPVAAAPAPARPDMAPAAGPAAGTPARPLSAATDRPASSDSPPCTDAPSTDDAPASGRVPSSSLAARAAAATASSLGLGAGGGGVRAGPRARPASLRCVPVAIVELASTAPPSPSNHWLGQRRSAPGAK